MESKSKRIERIANAMSSMQSALAHEKLATKDSWSSTAGLRKSLEELKTVEIFELLETQLKNDGFQETDAYWSTIFVLQRRPVLLTFQICKSWFVSTIPAYRSVACNIIGELGVEEGLPFRERSQPLLENLLNDKENIIVGAALIALGKLEVGDLHLISPLAKHSDIRWLTPCYPEMSR
jgi:hypothetical protein